MKRSARTFTALAAALLIPLGAFAADAVAPATTTEAAPAPEAKVKKVDPKCEPSAASRIRRNKPDCGKDSPQTRTYSKEELERTGQTDTAEALRRLDPRFN